MASVSEFCGRLGITLGRGATDAQLSAYEKETGLSLPPEVQALYRTSNGLDGEKVGFQILSLDATLLMARCFRDGAVLEQHLGYFPFTESNDSNPYCIACQPPLRGRVIRVYHDDAPHLQFRSLGSFLDAVIARMEILGEGRRAARGLLDSLKGEYDGSEERTVEDVAAGRELLRIAGTLSRSDGGRTDLYRFGMNLLSDQQLDEIAPLLYYEHYVRKAAVERLRRVGGLRATAEVERVTGEMMRFSERAALALRQAGLRVATVSPHAIRLEPGPIYLNMDFLFDERERPDPLGYIVERAKFFLSRNSGR